MGIIFKFLVKSIREKKMRTFLIVFSITISAALFFASSAITDSLTKMYVERLQKQFGNAEVVITSGKKSPSKYFKVNIPSSYKNEIEYSIGLLDGLAIYKYKVGDSKRELVRINLRGIEWNDQDKLSPVILNSQQNIQPFKGKKIVISKKTSDKYDLKSGETLELEVNGEMHKFKIAGVAEMAGPFADDGQSTFAIVPLDILSSIYEQKGNFTSMYIKLTDPANKDQLIDGLADQLKRYTVKDTISKADLQEQVSGISVALSMSLIIVIFMSVFIIYTSFKVIAAERLPVIGTFRSIGATRTTTNIVLLTESLFYGAAGGILGTLLGIGILYMIAKATASPWLANVKTTVEFSIPQLAAAFIMAVLLSVTSSIIPMVKVSKISVKDIVLNKLESSKKLYKKWKLVLGLVFLAAVFLIPPRVEGNTGMMLDMICMLLAISSIILMIPYLTWGFIKIFEALYVHIFGNEGVLAVKNLRNNRSILNNISLLAIGISSLLMINTTSHSSISGIINYFDTCMKYDTYFFMDNMDRSLVPRILKVDGVKGAVGMYQARGIEVKGTKKIIETIEGIDKNTYMDYVDIRLDTDTKARLEELDTGRNIIMCGLLKNTLGLKVGDTITLKMSEGDRDYKIIDFWDSMMMGGNYAIISARYMKLDMGQHYFDYMAVKTKGDPSKVLKNLNDKFSRSNPNGMTIEEIKHLIVTSNQQMFKVLNGFSLMTVLIGIFGVLNNLLISFIERKRSIAVLRSMGMNKLQIIKMIFIESITGGFIGGVVGVLAGLLMITIMSHMLKIVIASIPMHYSNTMLLMSLLSGIIITVAASISPALKSSKLNIIEAIKYE